MNEPSLLLAHIDWEKAWEYKAYKDVEKLIRDELHRRRGALMLIRDNIPDPSQRYFDEIHSDVIQRLDQLYYEAYEKGKKNEEADPSASSGETAANST